MSSTELSYPHDSWRQAHLGHWMDQALQRFDARVLSLMSRNENVPLALSNLAARGSLSASHIHITRHLALEGSRLTELARRASMSKQAMGKLVDQCEAWGLVRRIGDPRDARAQPGTGAGDEGDFSEVHALLLPGSLKRAR